MKKILTLLIAAGSFGALHAQNPREEARRVILGDPDNSNRTTSRNGRDIILGGGNDRNNYPSGSSSDAINREYDSKIASIRNNPYLSSAEKERTIRQLESDRARRLREVNRGRERDYDYRANGDRRDKRYKSNNGKHKGWTKGKGNIRKNKDRDDD
ncbi:MAG TPA: hypothetical protein VFR58_04580 [Flavisolibacter sp.]|nr:hypothetical protein [Flavisolibacter sp.]